MDEVDRLHWDGVGSLGLFLLVGIVYMAYLLFIIFHSTTSPGG